MRPAIFAPVACVIFSVAATPLRAADFKCAGTEPFWDVAVSGSSLTFKRAGFKPGPKMSIASTLDASGVKAGVARVIKTRKVTLTLVKGTCSDGMSDDKFSHHAVLVRRSLGSTDDVFYGCCNLK
jgi:uncharacterized membrane protein